MDTDPLPQGAGVAMAVPPVAFGTRAHGIALGRVGSSLSFTLIDFWPPSRLRGLSASHASWSWKAALMVASLYRFQSGACQASEPAGGPMVLLPPSWKRPKVLSHIHKKDGVRLRVFQVKVSTAQLYLK